MHVCGATTACSNWGCCTSSTDADAADVATASDATSDSATADAHADAAATTDGTVSCGSVCNDDRCSQYGG